ncbi:hypothetical protein PoB_004760500 [Plakobranchus ocellatus]|uniref:Uncharacterized protein n=1 Tax=Plakobranchus ocellatus TaxID=259542 RepID=A0AAV4BKQ1_9GAST|nr:hypothetical protein PoB_004760500 [Plakobranchus ocellatus]
MPTIISPSSSPGRHAEWTKSCDDDGDDGGDSGDVGGCDGGRGGDQGEGGDSADGDDGGDGHGHDVMVVMVRNALNSLSPEGDVGSTVASVTTLRSAGTLLSRVRAPSPAPWPVGMPESLRSPCCGLAIYKNQSINLALKNNPTKSKRNNKVAHS